MYFYFFQQPLIKKDRLRDDKKYLRELSKRIENSKNNESAKTSSLVQVQGTFILRWFSILSYSSFRLGPQMSRF